jgi:hypothetical protein
MQPAVLIGKPRIVGNSATGIDGHPYPYHDFSKMFALSGIGTNIETESIKARIKGIIFAVTERSYSE